MGSAHTRARVQPHRCQELPVEDLVELAELKAAGHPEGSQRKDAVLAHYLLASGRPHQFEQVVGDVAAER